MNRLALLQQRRDNFGDYIPFFCRKVYALTEINKVMAVLLIGAGGVIKIFVVNTLAHSVAFIASPGRFITAAAFGLLI